MSADLIVFGEDWAAHPSSTQHLVANLPGTRRVLWVNSLGLRAPRLDAADLRRLAAKLRRAAAPVAPDNDGWRPDDVVQPLIVPMALLRPVRALNRALLARGVGRAAARAGIRRPVLWTSLPSAADALGALDERAVVYYCGDDFSALAGVDHAAARALEAELAARADLILAASPALAARFAPHKTHLLPHGVDRARFATPVPPARDLPRDRPVAGFYGALASWIDTALIAATARLLPGWRFVLVGPVQCNVTELRACPNVTLLGARPHAALPGYAQHWTAGLIPFRDTAQIRAANPLKLREYLAAGRPIVATAFPALAEYRPHVLVRAGPDGFAEALEAARHDTPQAAAGRQASVASDSWEARAGVVAALIDGLAP